MNRRQQFRRGNIISAPSLKRHHINQSIGSLYGQSNVVFGDTILWHINFSASYCLQSPSDTDSKTFITSSSIIRRLVAVLFLSYRRQLNRCFNRTNSIYIYFHRDNTVLIAGSRDGQYILQPSASTEYFFSYSSLLFVRPLPSTSSITLRTVAT